MSSKIEYTCKGKGGRYEILGLATGAGLTRGEDRLIYKDVGTDRLFLRTEADFTERMERLKDTASVVEHQPYPIYQVRYLGDGGAGWMDIEKHELDQLKSRKDYHTRTVFDAPPELAELQAELPRYKSLFDQAQKTIDRVNDLHQKKMASTFKELTAEIERLKGGQGEPVAYTSESALRMARECHEYDGCSKLRARTEKSDHMNIALYTSQPAPVSVVMPERMSIEDDAAEPKSIAYDVAAGWNACLDKVKELNQ